MLSPSFITGLFFIHIQSVAEKSTDAKNNAKIPITTIKDRRLISDEDGILNNARYLIPNAFTCFNFLIGIWAILFATGALPSPMMDKSNIVFACHLVIYCVLLDKLDGFAAKSLNASSAFGAQFDSLADLIAFGVAPAICLFYACHQFAPDWFAQHTAFLLFTLSVYVACAAIRLAKYNAMDADAFPDFFMGLPSTLAGALNVVLIILAAKYQLFEQQPAYLTGLVLFQLISGLLMITPLLLPKLQAKQNKLLNIVQIAAVVTGYIFGFAMIFSEYLALLVGGYAIGGLIYGLSVRRNVLAQARSI